MGVTLLVAGLTDVGIVRTNNEDAFVVADLDRDTKADVAKATKAFIDEAGWSEVGLLSLSSADYSQIEPLVACLAPELAKTKVSISLPSLRAEAFSVALADAVSEVRKSGFTFAPETGSDRLRRVINKTFTNADMVKAADVAFSRGWDMIKVYSMIGLPTETEPDLDELVTLVKDILAQGRKHGIRPNVNVSVGCFVPKSFTPFQWFGFDGIENLERKVAYLKDRFRSVRGAKMTWHEPKEAEIEAMLSLGDRRMGRAVFEVWKRGGRFDASASRYLYTLMLFVGLALADLASVEADADRRWVDARFQPVTVGDGAKLDDRGPAELHRLANSQRRRCLGGSGPEVP